MPEPGSLLMLGGGLALLGAGLPTPRINNVSAAKANVEVLVWMFQKGADTTAPFLFRPMMR